MPPKRKGKRGRKGLDPVAEEKIRKLKELQEIFKTFQSEYETHLNTVCSERCDRIEKLYMDKLKAIPENIRNMTITEVIDHQEKELHSTETFREVDAGRSLIEKCKMMSEKKRTLKKEVSISVSATASAKPLTISRPTATFSRMSRTVSDTALNTPARSNRLSNMVVTPKFNPKFPVSHMARIPKPGEVVMSLSGSPLQNVTDEKKITLSLGGGKVLTISDETDLEKELIAEIDEPMKKTIKALKEKLDKILQT
ncbi:hypothetical protein CEXT_317171 [Caerostris extrusa]|uniref:Borealin C-terminal domain-containing protein n=1 Tax=Caerostris extrusa TaxID=172846 RepID=A0AAV4TFE6_CAEEX|nr:hypothetical protein CEXT_317171 [Caerostris extrusa]